MTTTLSPYDSLLINYALYWRYHNHSATGTHSTVGHPNGDSELNPTPWIRQKKFASADEVTFFFPRQISAYSIFFWLLCDFDSGQRNCLLIRQLSTVFRAFSSGTSGLSNFYQNLISTTRGTNHKMASVSFRPVCVCVWICVCMRSGFSVLHTRYSVFCGIGFAVCIYLAENCRSIKTGQPVESWRAKKLFLISLPAILLFNLSSFLFPFLPHTHTYTFSCL